LTVIKNDAFLSVEVMTEIDVLMRIVIIVKNNKLIDDEMTEECN